MPTQAERSAATRTRLLDATLDCLVELGWAGTSTTEVVARAGVSRGAQVHHFPTKEDLVLAAVEHLVDRRLAEYRAAFARLPDSERTTDAAFDLLRSQCGGPAMDAWFELAIAARTNAALHERFVAVDRRFWDAALANLQEMFPEAAADPALANLALRLSFCVVDGLSLGRLLDIDPAELDAVADTFKLLIAPFAFRPQETLA
ncbi:MAG TPA: TetR/AcrR family transcriptional regulator [Acidimicrobiales bacterium]|nr:TetR/AcrR family transcriptional regulator [Acidimicrobiales bacterium]